MQIIRYCALSGIADLGAPGSARFITDFMSLTWRPRMDETRGAPLADVVCPYDLVRDNDRGTAGA
jgi:hypothetical protein